jgi:hypothetical protein
LIVCLNSMLPILIIHTDTVRLGVVRKFEPTPNPRPTYALCIIVIPFSLIFSGINRGHSGLGGIKPPSILYNQLKLAPSFHPLFKIASASSKIEHYKLLQVTGTGALFLYTPEELAIEGLK